MRYGAVLMCTVVLIAGIGLFAGAQERMEHRAIVISNDYEFTPKNGVCAGSGTPEDPYLIQGWKIDAGYDDYGIRIHGTTRYFVIRDVEISGAAKSGIHLSYVRNGRVEGSRLNANWTGVTLSFCTFVRISDCVFETNTDGVHAYYTTRSQLLYNVFDRNDTAVWFDASNENEITGNLIRESHMGVYFNLGSTRNRVTLNAFVSNLHNAHTDDPNTWNNDDQGNYWSDYKALDTDEDGVWDAPYLINSDGDQDCFPLVIHPLVPAPAPETCGS